MPVLVTEHGMSTADDTLRAAFIEPSLAGLRDVMDEGVPVLGYIHWTLLDNFEWVFGYAHQLGLHEVDRETFERHAQAERRCVRRAGEVLPRMTGLRVRPRCRVVLDNDWAGDPDGLVALAHHLLSAANQVDAITSTGLDPMFGSPRSTPADGAAIARALVSLLDADVPVHADDPEAIVTVARADHELPLYVVCGGPLTNVAAALRLDPGIAQRFRLVWVGGSISAGAEEYNRDTDPDAAAYVLGTAALAIDQFPLETYRQCAVSVAELEVGLAAGGPAGAWLWQQFRGPPAA